MLIVLSPPRIETLPQLDSWKRKGIYLFPFLSSPPTPHPGNVLPQTSPHATSKLLVSKKQKSGPEKGVITKGVFSPEESLESLHSPESLENGRILLCFQESGGSLESLKSLNSVESLEHGLFWEDPFSKRPLLRSRKEKLPPIYSDGCSWHQK